MRAKKNELAFYFLPSKALSRSSWVGLGLFLKSVYMVITIPGVQNPHCRPWYFIRLLCWFKFEKRTDTLGYQKILTRGLWNLCIYNILIILTCKMSVVNFTCWNKKNMLGKQILKFAYWSVISAFGLTLYFSPRCRSTL